MRQSYSIIPWVFCVGLVLFGLGCQSKDLKHPEDYARFERIVKAVEILRSAYADQNTDALQELMLPLEGLQRLQSDMQRDFTAYSAIALTMTIERMSIQGEQAKVNVRWEGEWQPSPEDKVVTDRGHGVLIWSGKQVILLAGVDGDVPFGMAAKQAMP